jgi:hypothetical protein
MKFSFQSLIPFFAIILQLPIVRTRLNSSVPRLISWQAGVSKLDSTLLSWTLLYNHFARTTQKTQPIYFFRKRVYRNGSYSIVACAFVAAEMCLPCRCLTMNVFSDFTVPAFGRHVTICLLAKCSHRINNSVVQLHTVNIVDRKVFSTILKVYIETKNTRKAVPWLCVAGARLKWEDPVDSKQSVPLSIAVIVSKK